jgi:hypothetical protein
MDILRIVLYIVAPWMPFLLRRWLYHFKVGQILFLSITLLLPFACPLLMDYSFSTQGIFSLTFILFLISTATLFWMLTNNLKFIIFVILINVCTIFLFWIFNWQKIIYTNKGTQKPVILELKKQNSNYSDIEETILLGNYKLYQARKKVLGGLLVRKFDLKPITDTLTECIYKGYDYDRKKDFYWDKCNDIINEP